MYRWHMADRAAHEQVEGGEGKGACHVLVRTHSFTMCGRHIVCLSPLARRDDRGVGFPRPGETWRRKRGLTSPQPLSGAEREMYGGM